MGRSLGVIVAGVIVGGVLVALVEMSGTRLFPLPAGIDPMNEADLTRAMEAGQIPLGAMLFVILAYAVGSLGGGWLAARLVEGFKLRHALIVGAVLMLMGVSNLVFIPHPAWMAVATLVAFLPAAYVGGRLAGG